MQEATALPSSAQLEVELGRDRWDARNIPGLRYPPHTNCHYVHFAGVPELFRPSVKEYARFLLAAGRVAHTLDLMARSVGKILTLFVQRYPGASTLQELTKQDVDFFISCLRTTVNKRGNRTSNGDIWLCIHSLEDYLHYLERTQHSLCPKEPTSRIVWPEHYPNRESWRRKQKVKYIPQAVLAQIDICLHYLPSHYIPVGLLLRASGWRISDVLCLKLDTCLKREGDHYWLVGDIQKTRVLGHQIPITSEVAAVILAQIEWVKQHYTLQENPHGWLFPASKRPGNSQRFSNGGPLGANGIRDALHQLVVAFQIQDEQGNLFHLQSHAFRHTKAVELINNGMSLVLVQQWMAHASPEMTLIYAKILDETMRNPWEKTVQRGIVQFNDGKPELVPGKMLLPMSGSNAFDPERVREHRQNVKMALGSCLKTAKIMCKFVELPCFHCPAYVLTPDDLPALNAYEQQILERIEVGKQAGNVHWIEVNQKNLDERVRPAIALLKQGNIVAKNEKYEREYTDEEWEQRKPRQQESPA